MTTISNTLALIDQQKLAEVATLPEILALNKELAEKAEAACQPALEKVKAIDLQAVDAVEMDAVDVELNELQVRAKAALTKAKARREPYTQFFDQVRSLFTTEEKRFTDLDGQLKGHRDAWAKEKGRRAAEAERLRQLELEKKREAIDLRARIKNALVTQFTHQLAGEVKEVQKKFYAVSLDSMDLFENNLKGYEPMYTDQQYGHLTISLLTSSRYLDATEVATIKQEVVTECLQVFQEQYASAMVAERERIIELIPSRRRELEEIAAGNAQAAKEAEERQRQEQEAAAKALADQQAEQAARIEQEKAAANMNAAFDIAATATPTPTQAAGTRVKKKIIANTHAAWAAIMQLWVSKAMPGTDLATLEKKLGFMRTFAEKWINDTGEVLTGVQLEDDYSTSARKKAS
jgi:hypothetical protein